MVFFIGFELTLDLSGTCEDMRVFIGSEIVELEVVLHSELACPKEEGNAENTEMTQKAQKKENSIEFFCVFLAVFCVFCVPLLYFFKT